VDVLRELGLQQGRLHRLRDDDDDGECVQIVITWYGSGGKKDTDYSPQACPQGNKDTFDKMPGDSTHWSPYAVKIAIQKV
jgi:hypothetical protein